MSELTIGDIVQAPNKSGIYVGELVEDRHDKYLVKVLAVLKHPMQGDLHHPKQVENVVFHERKALAQFEKVNVLKSVVKLFEDELPEYGESLQSAVEIYRKQLESKDTPYNQEALKALKVVEESYYLGKYY
ncbi:sporulation phosphorelay system protein KapB [Paucisalibacillus globulus]|jgi:kinase-associated protein B|uniref:sporulation phosphorelay system protein KapB n=1 Tax=Paucisalibacillus globulus TaxID=351095 RepID=UPI000BB8B46A|nr:sporulation phosphorelay system protein KapB [Paucisalibacillus globulus]